MIELSNIPWMSITVFLPLLGALILMMVPAEHDRLHRLVAMAFMCVTFLVSMVLVALFDSSNGGYQLTSVYENVPWIASIGARYHLGMDGISLWLVMLTTFLGPCLVLASYNYIDKRVKEFHISLLILQTAMLGTFLAQDVLLFYVFWEAMLIPMYVIIGVWGSDERIYAAVKLFIYTMAGSLMMLVGILYVYGKTGNFALADMMATASSLSIVEQRWLFAAFAVAFLIKIPVFPLHTWLPNAHTQAPTAGSVVLAGILLKMGVYGLIRFAIPMFPDAAIDAAPILGILGVIGIIYGAIIAIVQPDAKKLVAYSSISHLGFVLLGLAAMTPQSMSGAVFQCLAHGITTSGLFLIIGIFYERRHSRELDDFGGLAKVMPRMAVIFVIMAMGSIGVPGLVGFAGEFPILLGSAQSRVLSFGNTILSGTSFGPELGPTLLVVFATSGVILGAIYVLSMVQRYLFGPIVHEENRTLADLSLREMFVLVPLAAMTIFMGLQPQAFYEGIQPAVERTHVLIQDNATGTNAERLRDETDATVAQRRFAKEGGPAWGLQKEVQSSSNASDN